MTSYVVVGLSGDCEANPGSTCVSFVNGPFFTRDAARDHAGTLPEGFHPHVMALTPMDDG